MKRFIYCEVTEGGMNENIHTFSDKITNFSLFGWMQKDCKEQDEAFLQWANTCKVGDYCRHRLGICFRVNPK